MAVWDHNYHMLLMSGTAARSQVVAFIKGTRTQPQCGFSFKVLSILNDIRVPYEVVSSASASCASAALL